jgi:hypothetical protein
MDRVASQAFLFFRKRKPMRRLPKFYKEEGATKGEGRTRARVRKSILVGGIDADQRRKPVFYHLIPKVTK